MNDAFQDIVKRLATRPRLAGLLPPRELLTLLLSSTQEERVQPRALSDIGGKDGDKVLRFLREHVRLPSIAEAAFASSIKARRWEDAVEDTAAAGQAQGKAENTFRMLVADLSQSKSLPGSPQGVFHLKDLQTDPYRDDIHRFGFGSIPLVVIKNESEFVEAVPLLPNCGESVSAGWSGLKVDDNILVKSDPSRADVLFHRGLRCRLYPWQLRPQEAGAPAVPMAYFLAGEDAPDSQANATGEHPWCALAACDSLWAARQIFDARQKGTDVKDFWIVE